ncbi:hypothetical protein C8R47DRAFT_1216606 [Mycena vitilis]|nr:hypothetical protein C8R47DRAFT_1230276 [Mycena vitilis]KAJ6478863.1 hypothetical protein C8R47DRAFT_1219409 [Mycena vitilis]KAJ6486499.1 hypothetical protein C8R47DRAFT_1216606 [Mycena vitilis]
MVIDSDDDQIATALAQWAEFDDDTRPDALNILAHALVLRQQRLLFERQTAFSEACKKCRTDNSLQMYKRREDARRAVDRCRLMPPGVPDDCPIILVDGFLEVLPFGDQGAEDDSPTPTPRSLSEIEQDQSDSSDADSNSVVSNSAVQSHEDEDAAAAADTLAALADLPSPQLAPSLLPSPDLPSPIYHAHAHTARCLHYNPTCRYGPARLEGQVDGENVEDGYRPLRFPPGEELEYRAGIARGMYRAWELALNPPSRTEPGYYETPEDEMSRLTNILQPSRSETAGDSSTSEAARGALPSAASGDLTLAEIQEVEDAWVRVLRAVHRETEEQNEVIAVLLQGQEDDGSRDGGEDAGTGTFPFVPLIPKSLTLTY